MRSASSPGRRKASTETRRGRAATLWRVGLVGVLLAGVLVSILLWGLLVGDTDDVARARDVVGARAPVGTTGGGDLALTPEAMDAVASVAASELGRSVANTGSSRVLSVGAAGPVYVALRQDGRLRGEGWGQGVDLEASLRAGIAVAAADVSADTMERLDTVELAFTHSYRVVDLADRGPLTNVHRGVRGLELYRAGVTERFSPTWVLATNRSFDRILDLYAADHGLPVDDRGTWPVDAWTFDAQQVLVSLEPEPRSRAMERGNVYVPLSAVDHDGVQELADTLSDWLINAVHADGRMTYKYWPSSGTESDANNMIRQWMATTALGRVASSRSSDELWQLTHRNIRFNLQEYYAVEGGLGLIIEDGTKVKLGAVALAGRALAEHPDRERYAAEEESLRRMVDHLWRPDGSFKTWYRPEDNTGQENFYPGEALYYWAALLRETDDDALLDRFMRSFEYYRQWHLDEGNRNPAFIPWHTQAYYEVWQRTRDRRLADFIFEMNDWLLGMQEWEAAVYRDTAGRFYDATRPHFGVPHASATGVYLEGLVDAFDLARELGDDDRAAQYRTAIRRGLRSIMQLQFGDEVDTFYLARPERVLGGVRTTVYDNEIRVDNVQHNLMAVLKVLASFEAADFDNR